MRAYFMTCIIMQVNFIKLNPKAKTNLLLTAECFKIENLSYLLVIIDAD